MGSVVGSVAYMSPEQASGKLNLLGPASDVYSLGATLYCILTGHPPLFLASPEELIRKVQEGDFPGPQAVNLRVPRPLDAICLKALSKDIQDRYSSAGQLADELELWLAGEPVGAYPESMLERSYRWVRRHRVLVTTLSGIAASSVLILSMVMTLSNRETNPTETDYLRTQSTIQLEQSGIFLELGKMDEALTQIRACKHSCEAIFTTPAFTDLDQSLWLLSHAREMRILLEMRRPDEVVRSSESLISETRNLSTAKPLRIFRYALPLLLTHSANAHIDSKGSIEAADATASEAIKICESLFATGLNVSHIAIYSTALRARGIVLRLNNNLMDSEMVLAQAKTQAERLVRAASIPDHHALLAKSLFEIAMTKSAAGDTNAGRQSVQLAIESLNTACQQSPESVLLQQLLSDMKSLKL